MNRVISNLKRNGRMYFRLEHTDELMDYLADKKLL